LTTSDITFRKAQPADLDGLFELWWEMQTYHEQFDSLWYSPKERQESKPMWLAYLQNSLSNPDSFIFVAIHDSNMVGMVKAQITGRPDILRNQIRVVAVENAIVTQSFRRRGIFRRLMELLIEEARAAGARAIKLSVYNENPARLVYKKLGFSTHELGQILYL